MKITKEDFYNKDIHIGIFYLSIHRYRNSGKFAQ